MLKAIKYELKIIHKKEVVVGTENREAAEEILQAMIAAGQEFNVSNAELLGVLVEKKDECTCLGACENCSYLCPVSEECMMGDFENRCADCEYLCPKCGSCTLVDGGKCGDDECEKCHWHCSECGKCTHPEGEKQP